jgi:hypothetical protein
MTNYNTAYNIPTNQYDQRYDINYDQRATETVPYVMIVDSRYRDAPSTTEPNNYTTTLINKYSDVTAVELVYASIPNSNYNVTSTTNTLQVMTSGAIQSITYATITAGSAAYTGVVSDPGGNATFTVTLNSSGNATSVVITNAGTNYDYGQVISLININSQGGRVDITVASTPATSVTIPNGLYQINSNAETDIALQLKNSLNSTLTSVSWDVSIFQSGDAEVLAGTYPTGILRIKTDISFALKNSNGSLNTGQANEQLLYNANSIAPLLGYKPVNVGSTLDSSYESYSPYPVALEMDHYIGMFIDGMERCESNYDAMQGAFCIVPLDALNANFGMFKDGNNIDNDQFKHYFPQPKKLADLKISFRDWNGNPYDFQGLNHTLMFKVDTLTNRSKFVIN